MEERVHLTQRELEVLELAIDGQSSKTIAEKLYISKRTADFHIGNIYEKLGVSNRVQAMRVAMSKGLVKV